MPTSNRTTSATHLTNLSVDISEAQKNLAQLGKDFDNIAKRATQDAETIKSSLGLKGISVKVDNSGLQKTSTVIAEIGENAEVAETRLQRFAKHLTNRAQWMASYAVLDTLTQSFMNIGNAIIEAEDAAIELQRVLGSGAPSLGNMKEELLDLAYEYGQTFENVQEVAVRFAQTGMDWSDTIAATRATMLGLNTAELEVDTATQGLIAVMAQFKIEADDLETVIDKINITADNFPVTSEKIVAALQRAGGTASAYNMTLEETIGLITALSEATGRSGESIGTALNSLISFTMKDSALSTFSGFLGFDVSQGYDVLQIWELLGEKIKGGDTAVAEFMASSAEFADLFNEQIAEAVGAQDELNLAVENSEDVYSSVGVYRKNYFIALLNNIATATEAMQGMANATGYSVQENETAMEALSKKINQLKAAAMELAVSLGESGVLDFAKTLVDGASAAIRFTDSIGGLNTVLSATLSIMVMVQQQKIMTKVNAVPAAIGSIISSVKNLRTALMSLNTAGVVGLISTVATAFYALASGIKNARKEAEEFAATQRTELVDTAVEARGKLDSLQKTYEEYQNTLNSGNLQKANQAQSELLSLLGYTDDDVKALTKDGRSLNEVLQEQYEIQKELLEIDIQKGIAAAEEKLQALNVTAYNTVEITKQAEEDISTLDDDIIHGNEEVINKLNELGVEIESAGLLSANFKFVNPQNYNEAKVQLDNINTLIKWMGDNYTTSELAQSKFYENLISYKGEINSIIGYLAIMQGLQKKLDTKDTKTTTGSGGGGTSSGTTKTKEERLLDSLNEKLEVYEHSIFLMEKSGESADKMVSVYRTMQQTIHALAEQYRKMGLSEDSEYIRKLQEMWWEYQDEITDLLDGMYEDSVKARKNAISLLENQYGILQGSGDYGGMTANLEKQLKAQLEIQELAHNEAQRLRKLGADENDEAIQDCINAWWSAADDIDEIKEKMQESVLQPFDDFIDLADDFDLWDNLDISKFDYLQTKLSAINDLFKDSSMSVEKYNQSLQEIAKALYNAQMDDWQKQIDDIEEQRDKDIKAKEEEIDLWEEEKEKVEKYYDSLIDSLNEVQEDNDRINQQLDYYSERQKVITNLEQAQARSGVEYRQQEMEYQQELIDLDKDWNRTQQEWNIDDQINRLETLKETAVADIDLTIDKINKAITQITDTAEADTKRITDDMKIWAEQLAATINQGVGDGLVDTQKEVDQAWAAIIQLLGGEVAQAQNTVVEAAKESGTESKTAFDTSFVNPTKQATTDLSKYIQEVLTSGVTSAAKSAASSWNTNFTQQVQSELAKVQKQTKSSLDVVSTTASVATKIATGSSALATAVGTTVYVNNQVASMATASSKTSSILQNTKI